MKSMGNLMHKIMSSISISSTGNNSFATPAGNGLSRHRRASISASTSDMRSHNSRNNIVIKSTPGVTGLRNHGNTCFMNAVLQCICHTDILAEYFVMDQYKIDLTRRNKKNSKKFGTRGEVTEQLALLLKSLWSCQYTPEISNQFKTIVGKYESQYLGTNQHDAQEFLLWLLDKVHEDLNTATKKKYKKIKFIYPGSQGRAEEAVAAEALSNHMRCNSSFVHDLFQALYRSSLTCPKCQSRSITFDPFLCVSIPIPQRQMRPVYVTVVYLNQQPKQVRLGLSINSQANIRELKEVLAADSAIPDDKIVITELVPEGFHHTFSDSQPLSSIHENDNIFAIQVPAIKPVNPRDGEYLLLVWINRLGTGCQGKRFGCPYVKEVPRECTFQELETAVLSTMSGILKNGVVEQVKHGPIVRFRVVDGIPGKCYLPYDVDHPLYMPTVDKAISLCDDERGPKHVKLIVEWDLETRKEMVLNIDDFIEEHSSVNQLKNQETQSATATLGECFELYTQEEKLGPENPWMCPSCKQLRQGVKRLGLWTVPDILVIHMKRFRQTSTQRIKLNTLVEFPTVGLDMSSHIVGRNFNNNLHTNGYSTLSYWSPWRRHRSRYVRNDDNLYDLYAVCNHHGNMQGGHYTAYCKNPTDGNWYSFDDTKVEQLQNEADVVSPHAYILFYQKSTLTHSSTSSSSSSSSGSSDHWAYHMPNFNYAPPKFSKSQDNLVGLKDDEFRHNSRKLNPFTRGIRPYCSMAPIGSHQKKTEAVIAEPDHYSDDDEQYNKVCITESRVEGSHFIAQWSMPRHYDCLFMSYNDVML
uniref:Ubiquitin carboxyl-terminal hydrolase n=1 Tax=Strigamia maritima TaxID=126957 RepID=T1J896_STRMM